MRDLKLPRFELGGQLAWPPHRPIDWSSAVPVARHPGADWASARERAMSVDPLPRSAVDCGARAVIDQNCGRFLILGSDHGKDTPDERCGNRPARTREEAHAEPDEDQLEVNGRRHGGFSQYDENR